MANAIKWESAWVSRSTVITTEANSLATATRTAPGSEIDNSTNLDKFGKLVLDLTFGVAPGAGAYVNVYALTAPDGTNYEDGSASVAVGTHTLVATVPVRAVSTAQKLATKIFEMEPAKTKFILENIGGQTLAASGNTVTLYTNNDEIQ